MSILQTARWDRFSVNFGKKESRLDSTQCTAHNLLNAQILFIFNRDSLSLISCAHFTKSQSKTVNVCQTPVSRFIIRYQQQLFFRHDDKFLRVSKIATGWLARKFSKLKLFTLCFKFQMNSYIILELFLKTCFLHTETYIFGPGQYPVVAPVM